MGWHAASATERDGHWFGTDVNRAARASRRTRTTIVCTRPVADQVRDRFTLDDLGEHRLRDLQASVHLFQIGAPRLPAMFPPLRSLDAYRSNLPYEFSSFVGRHRRCAHHDRVRTSPRGHGRRGRSVGKTAPPARRIRLLRTTPMASRSATSPPCRSPRDSSTPSRRHLDTHHPRSVTVAEGLSRFLERKTSSSCWTTASTSCAPSPSGMTATTAGAANVSVPRPVARRSDCGEHLAPLASLGVPATVDIASVVTSKAAALFVARPRRREAASCSMTTQPQQSRTSAPRLDGSHWRSSSASRARAHVAGRDPLAPRPAVPAPHRSGVRTSLDATRRCAPSAHPLVVRAVERDERPATRTLGVRGGFDLDAAVAAAVAPAWTTFEAFDVLSSLVEVARRAHRARRHDVATGSCEMIRQYAAEQLDHASSAAARTTTPATTWL